jgi:hypothetical protein
LFNESGGVKKNRWGIQMIILKAGKRILIQYVVVMELFEKLKIRCLNRYDWNNIIDDLVCKSSIFRTLILLSSRQKSQLFNQKS